MRREDWLAWLPPLAPADALMSLLDRDEEDAQLAAYRENLWLAHSVLRALHIEPELKQALQRLGILAGACVLDVGCASGMKSRFLLDMGAASVTGIDLDAAELRLAQTLPDSNASDLRFVQSDVLQALPFADDAFDFALVADGHIDFYDEKALREIQRVTRPDGHILFATTNLLPQVLYAHDRAFASRIEAARWATLADTVYAELATAGQSYEARFLRACHSWNMRVWQIPIQRQNPVPQVFETLIQQTFALFTGPMLRDSLSTTDWQHLRDLHNSQSPNYLFGRQDALFVDTLTLAFA
jgi:SAM-dependent methyltransferase